MSKQDRVYPRTAAQLERQYNFGRSFAEINGITQDVQTHLVEIDQTINDLRIEVDDLSLLVGDEATGLSAKLEAKLDKDKLVSQFNMAANEITITSDHFKLSANGTIEAKRGVLGLWDINEKCIFKNTNSTIVQIAAPETTGANVITVATIENGVVKATPFSLRADGFLYAKDCYIEGEINASEGYIGDWGIVGKVLTADTTFTFSGVEYTDTIQLSPTALTVIRKEGTAVIGSYSVPWYYVALAAQNARTVALAE